MTLASTLAEFAVNTRISDLPSEALERAEMVIASTLASVAVGTGIESARIVRELECANAGAPQASVWFDNRKLPLAAAAKCNAIASDAAASDDSDMRSIAHIGTIASTTAIAVAEHHGRSGADVLRAMVIGYEIAGRIDESLTPGRMKRGFHGSVSTVFGGTVAAGLLLNLDQSQMTHAISLAATSIGGMAIAADTSCAREYHAAMSAMLSVMAAQAAAAGFKTETGVLDAPRGFLSAMNGTCVDEITEGLGQSWDICTDMAIKLMPGAHPFHAIAEAAANVANEANVTPDQIETVIISAAQMKDWMAPNHPRDLIGAAHSVVYFVAAAIVDRGFTWIHMSPQKMADPVISALQNRVAFDQNPTPLPDRFTHRHGGTVTLKLKDGRTFSHTCKAAKGYGVRGIDWADVDDKYRHLMPASGLGNEGIERLLACVHSFRNLDSMDEFVGLLRRPASGH